MVKLLFTMHVRLAALEMVKYLIEDVNADISCQDMNGFTPLHLAAQFATLELVQYLIEERH